GTNRIVRVLLHRVVGWQDDRVVAGVEFARRRVCVCGRRGDSGGEEHQGSDFQRVEHPIQSSSRGNGNASLRGGECGSRSDSADGKASEPEPKLTKSTWFQIFI